jgi:hypothetical protein
MTPVHLKSISCLAAGWRRAIALLLIAAIGLGVLPMDSEVALLPGGERSACRFEPIDVCGAGDTSLGMLADTPVLLPTAVAVVAEPVVLPNAPEAPAPLREGFAPGVYRPPRLSC